MWACFFFISAIIAVIYTPALKRTGKFGNRRFFLCCVICSKDPKVEGQSMGGTRFGVTEPRIMR